MDKYPQNYVGGRSFFWSLRKESLQLYKINYVAATFKDICLPFRFADEFSLNIKVYSSQLSTFISPRVNKFDIRYLIFNKFGGDKKVPSTSFFLVTSTNVEISP